MARSYDTTLMLLGESPDFFLDAADGPPAVFGQLMQNPERLEKTRVAGGNLLRRMAAVELAEQPAHRLEADRIGIAPENASAIAHLGNEPNPHQTAFDAICLHA